MNRRYLPVGIIVIIIGVGFILLPEKIEMHIAPELVTVWEEKVITEKDFHFNTHSQIIDEGMSPYVEVWSGPPVTLNTSFAVLVDGATSLHFNTTDNPSLYLLPGQASYTILINGYIVEATETEVNAGLYFLRPMEPEYITYYPYRSFGYGMLIIGVLASIVFYIKGNQEASPNNQ